MRFVCIRKLPPGQLLLPKALLAAAVLILGGCGGDSSAGDGGGPPNPLPTISALAPVAAVTGGPDLYLRVYGTGFVASSIVEWNGGGLPTTLVNSTQVFAVVSAANRSISGTFPVTVMNPSPGGGVSNAVSELVGPPPAAPAGVGVIQLVS